MKTSTAITIVSLTAAATCMFLAFCRPRVVFTEKVVHDTDTVTVTRTDTLIQTRYVESVMTRTVTDTVLMTTTGHDTVYVPVPIEYKYELYDDAVIVYHGYRAGIDTLILYPKTEVQYITTRETVTRERPVVFGPSLTAGIDMDGNIRLMPGVSATFNIGSIKHKRR